MTPNRRILVIGLVVVLVAAAGFVAWRWLEGADSRLAAAVALAPEDSQRLTWTDWRAVRGEVDTGVTADSPVEQVEAFLDTGFSADLTSASALVRSSPTLHERYGVSPANLDWELLAQGPIGQLIFMGLPDDVDPDGLRETLRDLGYEESDGIWTASETVFAGIGTLIPELAHLRFDDEEQLLLASDDPSYLAGWGDQPRGTDADDGITDVVDSFDDDAESAVSAVIYSGDQVCGALAMSQADGAAVSQANELIADAGEINPIRGFAIATVPGGSVRVRMSFENEEQARTNADTRAVLAAGPAPGQGGDFSDRFTLGEVTADGRLVSMELEPVEGAYVISDLSAGPVLFATC